MKPDEAARIRTELDSMSAYLRGDAMVGLYLRHFAYMEAALDEGIRRATQMGAMEATLLLRHFEFHRKTQALGALVAKCIDDSNVKSTYHRTLTKVAELAEERNVLVHSHLGPNAEKGGLRIRRVHSSKRPSLTPIEWSVDQLLERISNLWVLQLELEAMTGFEDAEDIWYRRLGPELTDEELAKFPRPPSPPEE